jgi:hypothetical protein
MDKAIVEAYLKTVQEHTRKYVEAVEGESKAFAAALSAVKGIGLDPSLESRVRILEARAGNDHRFHTTINGLSEDIGDLNERLIHLERKQFDSVDPWINPSPPLDEENHFAFDSLQNEVVVDDRTTVVNLSPYIEAPVVVKKEYNVVEIYHADEKKAVKVEEKQEEQGEQEEQGKQEEQGEQEEGGVGEELLHEEEALNVDPFEYNGQTYYRDTDGNVYQEDEEGAVDDTPIGRWLEAKQKVKFYPKST